MKAPHVTAYATVAAAILLVPVMIFFANAHSLHAMARAASSAQGRGMPAARAIGGLAPAQQAPTPTPPPRRLPWQLALGVGGGDTPGLCRFFPRRVDEPTIIANWWPFPRTYDVCLMGFPEGTDVVATAADAQGNEFMRRFVVGPPSVHSDDQGEYEVTNVPVDWLWPGNVPGGTWHITVSAAGQSFDEIVDVPEADVPEADVPEADHTSFSAQFGHTPAVFRNPLRASSAEAFNCVLEYSYYPGDSMTIVASGFPARTRDVEVGIYGPVQSNPGASDSTRLSHWIADTDADGGFELQYKLPNSSLPGTYWVVAPETPEGAFGPSYISNCFVVERRGSQEITGPESTAAPQDPVVATVRYNANLRAGPGTDFARIGRAPAGTELVVVGINEDGTWYQLDTGAWIAAFLVRLER